MQILVASLIALSSALGLAETARPAAQDPAETANPLQAGPQHAHLQALAGRWDAVIHFSDPTGAEQVSHGTLTTTAHTAFHTFDSFEGEFMGMSMVGHGINGYCPLRKQFFTYWTDSMAPSPMVLYGDYDAAKRELAMSGECLGMSGKLEKCRTLAHYPDANHMNWSLFGPGPDGKELQLLQVEYTRKK